ncbi:MAG: clostripain-related cysteine peptidase [Bdellovibrionaceae bacterium]|nr:clostripain-related cysteine peptidase [Pseudobdellovibrionaceae bacterium]MDW8190977.1 clostripain-related cysteine peptidase [Pseudobdellovibrionaceae bacterium]
MNQRVLRFSIWMFLLFSCLEGLADLKWKVAIIFLRTREDKQLYRSIEENIKELKTLSNKKDSSSVSIRYLVFDYRRSHKKEDAQKMFPILQSNLREYFNLKPGAAEPPKTILILYGHGEGLHGLGPFTLQQLKSLLPKVDILWFDSCFMANVEALYELRNSYQYALASQDAEISSGIPYEELNRINLSSSVEATAFSLAEAFLRSYSKSLSGSQSNKVISSAITISVIDSQAWDGFKSYFKKDWLEGMLKHIRFDSRELSHSLNQLTMDDRRFVDLGAVAKNWNLKDLAEILDITEVRKERSKRNDVDLLYFKSKESDNPVKFFGYVKKIKGRTRTYSGLNVYNPFEVTKYMPYENLELIRSH